MFVGTDQNGARIGPCSAIAFRSKMLRQRTGARRSSHLSLVVSDDPWVAEDAEDVIGLLTGFRVSTFKDQHQAVVVH